MSFVFTGVNKRQARMHYVVSYSRFLTHYIISLHVYAWNVVRLFVLSVTVAAFSVVLWKFINATYCRLKIVLQKCGVCVVFVKQVNSTPWFRHYNIRSGHDLDLWPVTLKTFSAMSTHMMYILPSFIQFHPLSRDIASGNRGIKRTMDGRHTHKHIASKADSLKEAKMVSDSKFTNWNEVKITVHSRPSQSSNVVSHW